MSIFFIIMLCTCMLLCPLYRLHTLYHTLAKIYIELNLNLSIMEQVRNCAVWPIENWLGSSMDHIKAGMGKFIK